MKSYELNQSYTYQAPQQGIYLAVLSQLRPRTEARGHVAVIIPRTDYLDETGVWKAAGRARHSISHA